MGVAATPGSHLHRVADIEQRCALAKLLQTEPSLRCSVRAAAALPYWHAPEAEVCLAAVSAERGSFSLVRWKLDPHCPAVATGRSALGMHLPHHREDLHTCQNVLLPVRTNLEA